MSEKRKKKSTLKKIAIFAGVIAGLVAFCAFLKKKFESLNLALDFEPDYDDELEYDEEFDEEENMLVQDDAPQEDVEVIE